MRVFITGASGWIGSAVTDELLANGYEVVGLARSDRAAAALEAKGAGVHRGDLDDPDSLSAGAAAADAVIHFAFKHDFANFAAAGRTEHAAVERMLRTLEGSGRPFLIAGAMAGIPAADGRSLTEDDASPHRGPDSMRGGGENLALDYAERGVRSVVLRFPPTVHGPGDPNFVTVLTDVAKKHGSSGYIGDGSNRWAAVHRTDAARAVRLALEKAPAGSRIHPVAEEGLAARDIAAAIGAHHGLPTVSVPPEEADAHFGWIGRFFAVDMPASSARTRELLGWTPTGPTLFEEIAAGVYPGTE